MEKIVFIVVVILAAIVLLVFWSCHSVRVSRKHDLAFKRKYADLIGVSGYIDRDSKVFTVLDKDLSDEQRERLFRLMQPSFDGCVPRHIPCKLIDVHRSDAVNGFMELDIHDADYKFRVTGITALFIHFHSPELGDFNVHREDFPDIKLHEVKTFKVRVRKNFRLFYYQYAFYVDWRK